MKNCRQNLFLIKTFRQLIVILIKLSNMQKKKLAIDFGQLISVMLKLQELIQKPSNNVPAMTQHTHCYSYAPLFCLLIKALPLDKCGLLQIYILALLLVCGVT